MSTPLPENHGSDGSVDAAASPDHAPAHALDADPAATENGVAINTQNSDLRDGVNRCPACGSTDIQLRVSSGMLICLFCRHEWAEEKIDPLISESTDLRDLRGTTVASGATNIDPDEAGVITLKCAGCGSEVVVNTAEAMSSRCHWCRHVLTINTQVPNGAVPDAVLPFHITRDDAVARIRQFASKRRIFANRRFLAEFEPSNVIGTYLPYMVIDGNASADVWGNGEKKTREYTVKEGDRQVTYYNADVYQIHRHVDFTVDDLTVESSADRADMNTLINTNNVINAVLPFDTKDAVRWNANYLVGFTSERRDQDVEALHPVLEDQLLSIARSEAGKAVTAFDRGVRWEAEKLEVHGSRWVSMYLPIWLYSYYHVEKGKPMVHYIAVNGRTGKTMGSVPVSHGRLLALALTVGTILEGLAIAILVVT